MMNTKSDFFIAKIVGRSLFCHYHMQSFKSDFPIFTTHPDLIYLDSAASAQKPSLVIDGMQEFMQTNYANIHRGIYNISEQAEDLYVASKQAFAQLLNISPQGVIYTYNSTYAYNLLAQTLWYSDILQVGDVVLLSIAEHHANIIPRQMLAQRHGIVLEWIGLDENFQYNVSEFTQKYTDRVKVVSLSAASNVTGVVYDFRSVMPLLRDDTFLIIDGSQAVPHLPLMTGFADITQYHRVDAIIATGHKMMSDTGIGILALADRHLKTLQPARGGGGMIEYVDRQIYQPTTGRQKFEPGTPHIIGAVSLLKAIEYINHIGGYETIMQHEQQLIQYSLDRIGQSQHLTLLGPASGSSHDIPRLGIFSIVHDTISHIRLGEMLALQQICVRSGGHCAHPLFDSYGWSGSCRISISIYNDIADLDKTFDAIEKLV